MRWNDREKMTLYWVFPIYTRRKRVQLQKYNWASLAQISNTASMARVTWVLKHYALTGWENHTTQCEELRRRSTTLFSCGSNHFLLLCRAVGWKGWRVSDSSSHHSRRQIPSIILQSCCHIIVNLTAKTGQLVKELVSLSVFNTVSHKCHWAH